MSTTRSETGAERESVPGMGSTRLAAIDYGRGASVLVMMLVHALWMYGRSDAHSAP